ncbi:ImmA/IrrE family metallo-endopeptidase [Asticcacaulis excentricus]|uniref:ImmA/IrrE family metallo-endopeptidase n=1 Tax=Asticcacaulis excentricus TaxID=78587 RepID=UPI000F837DFB|nr:ImmA/IrrE family metallo-endopeptidase [Asticcacaulis excentricus]
MAYEFDIRRAKNSAKEIIERFDIKEPPVDPVEIARQLGLRVYFARFDAANSRISGFYDCDDNAIYVNEEEFPLRQTFTVAHELGHYILHREWAKSNDYKVLMRDEMSSRDPYEIEANEFAGNLLAPRFMLDKYWKELSVTQLSKLFAMSVPAINVRLSKEYGV